MGTEKVYADLQAAVAEAVAAMTEQRGRGYASDKESWADLAKRVEECDDLLREALAMTMNWLGVTAASKVALEMTEE